MEQRQVPTISNTRTFLRRAVTTAALLFAVSCSTKSDPDRKPTGTPTDPVETCERLADVCRLKGSKLGVCTQNQAGTGFICMSQH